MEQIHFAFSEKTRCQRRSPVDRRPPGRNFQCFRIMQPFAGCVYRKLIAAEFTFASQPRRKPPNRRMIKQQCFGDAL
jgi:hypothetical protein